MNDVVPSPYLPLGDKIESDNIGSKETSLLGECLKTLEHRFTFIFSTFSVQTTSLEHEMYGASFMSSRSSSLKHVFPEGLTDNCVCWLIHFQQIFIKISHGLMTLLGTGNQAVNKTFENVALVGVLF